jgi:hypothetical protein
MNHAEFYEARRRLFIGGGGIGGILGGLLGSLIAPEIGIPAALATGAGSFLGGLGGGAATGEPLGQAALGALPGAVLSGGVAGLGDLASTGDFLSASSPIGNLLGSGASTAGATGAASAPVAAGPVTAGAAATPALAPAAAAGAAPAAGAGAGVPVSGIAGTTGATPGDVSGALASSPVLGPSATTPAGGGGSFFSGGLTSNTPAPATLTQNLGTAAPTGGTSLTTPSDFSGGGPTPNVTGFDASGNPVITGSGAAQDFSGGAAGPASLGSKLASYLTSNPGLLLAGGGLATALMEGNNIPGLSTLQSQAGLEATQGNQNLQALQTGQLPAGAQAAIDQAEQAAKATTASEFARLGMTGSTSEAQSEAGVEQAAAAQKFNDLAQVSQLGLQEVGGANQLYQTIMNTQLQQDQETQNAIARLSAALAGSTGARAAAAAA